MNIEIGGLYSIPKNNTSWPQLYVKVIQNSKIYPHSVVAIDLLTTSVMYYFDRSLLDPLPKELADFSEEELKLYLRL